MNVLIASSWSASGVCWLLNCLLELDVMCYRTSSGHMWREEDGRGFQAEEGSATPDGKGRRRRMVLNPVEYQLQTHLPIFSRKKEFDFITGLQVEWDHIYPQEQTHYDKVVLFVRDPRDAVYSIYRRGCGSFLHGVTYAGFCKETRPYNGLSRLDDLILFHLLWLEKKDLVIARFEDYKADAIGTLGSVLKRVGLDFPDAQIRRAVENSTVEKAKEAEELYYADNPTAPSDRKKNRASKINEYHSHPDEDAMADKIHAATAGLFNRMGYSFGGSPPAPAVDDFLPRLPRNKWFVALPLAIRERADKLRQIAAKRNQGDKIICSEREHCMTNGFFTPDEVQTYSEKYANTHGKGFAALRKMAKAGRPVYLFGCGLNGQSWANAFANVNFAGFIDNNAELWGKTVAGLSVRSPQEIADSRPDALILGATLRRNAWLEMQAQCHALGLECDLFVNYWVRDIRGPAGPAEVEADADLGKGYRLMADDLSRETYRALARFWGTLDIGETPRVFPNQYFVEVVPTRFYRSFADVGAYDGDTLRQYIECLPWEVDNYYAIEPDPANLARLGPAAAALEKIELFPVAASDKRGILPWAAAGGSSQANEGGTGQVECDRLDLILSGRPVTFMKMDLEGHEMEALAGAAGIIAEQRPALAICVYHRYEHLWQVPTWIDSLVPNGYRFHLRHHSWGFMETVCYAVPV